MHDPAKTDKVAIITPNCSAIGADGSTNRHEGHEETDRLRREGSGALSRPPRRPATCAIRCRGAGGRIIRHPIQARWLRPISGGEQGRRGRQDHAKLECVALIACGSPRITPATTASATPRPCASA